jgi:hypothetical protein
VLPGFALILFLAFCAHAAGPLTADIKPLAPRARTGAPETFEVKLDWAGPGLLEGALELRFPFSDAEASQYRSHDLAVNVGSQSFRLLVPATTRGVGLSREVQARFVTKTGECDLGQFDFGTGRSVSRNLTICVSKPPFGTAGRKIPQPDEVSANSPIEDVPLWQKLRPEQFEPEKTLIDELKVSTMPVFVETSEMPATALSYTPYDVVVLEGEGFTLLREKQLAALHHWVLAGGSLFIESDASLEPGPRRFLEDLLAADVHHPVLSFDGAGRPDLSEHAGILLAQPGFGRLVVKRPEEEVLDPILKATNIAAQRKATTFLWKFRDKQIQQILNNGTWQVTYDSSGPQFRQYQQYRQQPLQVIAGILTPKQVRILPYPVVLLVLGAFVLVIGPLDWFVLGRLRMRRLTWVLFPLAAVGFTALTVFLAERYMGSSTSRSSLIITDLAYDDRVLRETRLELIFPARNQEITTEIRSALCVPLRIASNAYGASLNSDVASRYEGLFPSRYTMRQSLRQWSPQLNRLTSLEGGEDRSGLVWERLHPRELDRENWRERLGKDEGWEIKIWEDGELQDLSSASLLRSIPETFWKPASVGWLSVVAQLSPNGDADINDLALSNCEGHTMSATIVARREGEDIHVYRHLYPP